MLLCLYHIYTDKQPRPWHCVFASPFYGGVRDATGSPYVVLWASILWASISFGRGRVGRQLPAQKFTPEMLFTA